MGQVRITPFGAWKSPITADLIVGETVGLGQIHRDGDTIYWTESRPSEGGRTVLRQRRADGTVADLTPSGFNIRSRVHEYGGGAYTVHDGVVYFCNDADQRLHVQAPGEPPRALTASGPWRYADMRFDAPRERLLAVRETHGEDLDEPENALVAIDLDSAVSVLAAGADFYAAPRL